MRKYLKAVTGGTFAAALVLAGSPVMAQEPEMPELPPVEAEEPALEAELPQEPVVVELAAVGAAEGSGLATINAAGDQAEAVVEVQGLEAGQWAAFLIAGSCEAPQDVVAPLGTVEVTDAGSGRAEVALTASLADLTAGEASVQVHPAGDAPTEAVLCGALPSAGAAF